MRLYDADALVDALMTYTWRDEDERLIDDADEKRECIKQWLTDLPTVSGWVSVRDRMPDEDGSTLICTKNGRVCTARFYKHQGGWNAYAGRNAAYWMPLPTPPKEVSDGNVH